MNFIDEFTRYLWIFFLKEKSRIKDAFLIFKTLVDAFLMFKTLVELQTGNKIKTLQSNGRGEFQLAL